MVYCVCLYMRLFPKKKSARYLVYNIYCTVRHYIFELRLMILDIYAGIKGIHSILSIPCISSITSKNWSVYIWYIWYVGYTGYTRFAGCPFIVFLYKTTTFSNKIQQVLPKYIVYIWYTTYIGPYIIVFSTQGYQFQISVYRNRRYFWYIRYIGYTGFTWYTMYSYTVYTLYISYTLHL